MNESTARPAVTIDEGVAGLELRMCDGSLNYSGQRVVVAEAAEIFEEIAPEFGWRRDERCRAGVVVAAADSVLLGSYGPGVLLQPSNGQSPPTLFHRSLARP